MWNNVKKILIDFVKKTGLRYEHAIIPTYYVPYVLFDGLAANSPIQCDFEVTYRCNMYCDMCPQVAHREDHLDGGQIRHSPKGSFQNELTTQEIQGAITDLAKGGTKVVQFTEGEALLRKDLCDIMQHAKHCGLDVALITNGSLITPDIAARLVQIGVDSITFSLDGPKELHNKIRHLANGFDRLCNGISLIRSEKISQKKDRPHMTLSAVIQHNNQDQLADIVDVAHQVGIENLNYNFPFYTTPELEAATDEKLKSSFEKGAKPEEQSDLSGHQNLIHDQILSQLIEARKRATVYGVTVNISPSLLDKEVPKYIDDPTFSIVQRCFYPWKTMRVNAWGDVYPCSIDVHLGNIREQSILSIWNGKKYRVFRRTLKENNLFAQCSKCCVLTNRTWNKLPKLSMRSPTFARPIIQSVINVFR